MVNVLRATNTCTHPTIKQALDHLFQRCNYAATRDNVGFNGSHTEKGHYLASLPELNREQHLEALKILQTYQNTQLKAIALQLPSEMELRAWLREQFPEDFQVKKRSVESQIETIETIPEILPGITPNTQQWQALQELQQFVDGNERLHLLTGFAGTGKSVLIQALIKQMRSSGDRRSIVFTAFSNKATKVLTKMVDRWGLGIDCLTCCKLLGLKPEIDHATGKQVFRPDFKGENSFDAYDLIVVDECSMINAEMWALLTEPLNSIFCKTQILFVGDIAQLPPVNERESKCFSEVFNASNLTEVMRYGGAIGALAEKIRNRLDYVNFPKFETDTNDDRTEGLFVQTLSEWESTLIKAFTSAAYKQDPDYVRALAYTNKRVSDLNQKVRTAIYGKCDRFVVGERLMAMSPVLQGETVIMQTSSECEVLSTATGRSGEWEVWNLEIRTDEGKRHTIAVLHENSQIQFKKRLEAYRKEKRWREYYQHLALFADIEYAYAMTVHKSQGSTFQNVFVDVPNLLTNKNTKERNQLAYVAFTRAAKRLFIYQ